MNRPITINLEPTENGLVRATSPDVVGLHVVSLSVPDCLRLAGDMLEDLPPPAPEGEV